MHVVWHVTGGGDEIKKRGVNGEMKGQGERNIKCRDFSPVFFSRFLPFLHVFLYFESIFGDFLAIFSQPALFFAFTFSAVEIVMKKYFREVERGVFTPFLENCTTFVCQGRFLKFFRGVSFFSSPH